MGGHTSRVAVAALVVSALSLDGHSDARAADYPTCQGIRATIVGTRHNDLIVGTSRPDVIRGKGGADIICGGPGDDVVEGASGSDRLSGEGGNDVLRGQTGDDALMGGAGDDRIFAGRGHANVFYADPGNDIWSSRSPFVDLVFAEVPAPWHVDLVAGTATGWGSDTLHLGDAEVQLSGVADQGGTIQGTERADEIQADGAGVTVDAAGGTDDVRVSGTGAVARGGAGNDRLQGFFGAALQGDDGADQLDARLGATAYGGAGDDTVVTDLITPGAAFDGGDGTDRLLLGDSGLDNVVTVDLGAGSFVQDSSDPVPATNFENLQVSGSDGDLTHWDVTGTDGPNDIEFLPGAGFASPEGPVTVHALGGDDVVLGGGDDDTLYGGSGDDRIYGDDGDDTADGGDGTDTCEAEHVTNCES
jgi:Ca2+-binding RTX toxin-like protein